MWFFLVVTFIFLNGLRGSQSYFNHFLYWFVLCRFLEHWLHVGLWARDEVNKYLALSFGDLSRLSETGDDASDIEVSRKCSDVTETSMIIWGSWKGSWCMWYWRGFLKHELRVTWQTGASRGQVGQEDCPTGKEQPRSRPGGHVGMWVGGLQWLELTRHNEAGSIRHEGGNTVGARKGFILLAVVLFDHFKNRQMK